MPLTVDQLLATLAVDDVQGVSVSGRFALILRDPEPEQDDISVSNNVYFRLVDLDGDPAVGWAHNTQVYADRGSGWENVYYTAGGFVSPWNGGSSSVSSHGGADPYAYLDLTADYTSTFASRNTIRIRVLVNSGDLDETYWFRVEDTTQPQLVSADTFDQTTIYVTFTEQMAETGDGSILDTDKWTITRNNVDPEPGVNLTVTNVIPYTQSVAYGFGYGPFGHGPFGHASHVYVVTVNWEMTPDCPYNISLAATAEDESGNVIDTSYDDTDFDGFAPDTPEDRRFDLWFMLPEVLRQADISEDLRRWVNCLQEIVDLLLYEIDHMGDQIDWDLCTDEQIELLLYQLGNPFNWDELELTSAQKRKLASLLVPIYKLKGTDVGTENAIFLLLGKTVEIVDYLVDTWVLGVDELGDGSPAAVVSDAAETYDFSVSDRTLWVSIDGGHAIIDADTTANTVTIDGEYETRYIAGLKIYIADSTDNDGTYTVDTGGATIVDDDTVIPLVEALTSDTADGQIAQVITLTPGDFGTATAGTAEEVETAIDAILVDGGAYVSTGGTHASITSGNSEPYALSGAETLTMTIDGTYARTVTFHASDFAVPGDATAAEVAIRIALDVTDVTAEDSSGDVLLKTVGIGEGASIEITGGTANAVLAFSTTEVSGTHDGRVGIYSDTVGVDASVEIHGGTANTVLQYVNDFISGTGGAELGPSTQSIYYSFDIVTEDTLTANDRVIITKIAEWMKPAHTHLRNIRAPLAVIEPSGWVLGDDELGIGTALGT